MMSRHNTLQLENTVMLGGRGGMDSFAALIFPNSNRNSPSVAYQASSPLMGRKNEKNHLQKMEELEMNFKLKKKHLKVAFDEIDRLKQENNELRKRSEVYGQRQRTDSDALPKSNETEKEGSDDELEATL